MQLEAWGNAANLSPKPKRRQRGLERDLHSVLADLSEEYPLLTTLVEQRAGGQRQLPLAGGPSLRGRTPGTGTQIGVPQTRGGDGHDDTPANDGRPADPSKAETDDERSAGQATLPGHEDPPSGATGRTPSALPGPSSKRRPARYGLQIAFESRPEDSSLGRLIETTVWVNDAHPAYQRARASRTEGYHVALSVAMALAALAVEPTEAQAFVADFLASWGEAGLSSKP